MQWAVMDLHLHTPASSDFQQPEASYLDVLRRAEARGMDIIAFTDHNTVAGYRRMREEIQTLELLERLRRAVPEELNRLNEYRRLLDKVLVLPGFEFTATFGFHILGIFPPDKPVREIEHLLLDLEIPVDQLDDGSATVGATSDVLSAYRMIAEEGGLVIAAHANSSNGVAMRGFNFGGQTKIAYTQDTHLHALEVTDLDNKGKHSTATFFNGAKPEYPRRMHLIQGSDAHRITTDPVRKKNPGIGDRASEVFLSEISFQALIDLFRSNDFARTRPHRGATSAEPAYDFIRAAQEEGVNIIQDFHENVTIRGGHRYAVIADICAFANTNGGTLYLGLSPDPKKPVVGVPDPEPTIAQIEKEVSARISPPLPVSLDIQEASGKKIVRLLIPRGDDPPYAVDDNKIYIRSEAETGLAVRDEIVGLVLRSRQTGMSGSAGEAAPAVAPAPTPTAVLEPAPAPARSGRRSRTQAQPPAEPAPVAILPQTPHSSPNAPRTGVEVVSVEDRSGARYYTMRDLRNGNVVNNVTKSSARRLWHYAITAYASLPADLTQADIHWQGDLGLLRRKEQSKEARYDLVQRTHDGLRWYFGVTDDGIHGAWKAVVGLSEDD
jgi:hypothetical protein